MEEKFNILKKGEFFKQHSQEIKDSFNDLKNEVIETVSELDVDDTEDQKELDYIYSKLEYLRNRIRILKEDHKKMNQN